MYKLDLLSMLRDKFLHREMKKGKAYQDITGPAAKILSDIQGYKLMSLYIYATKYIPSGNTASTDAKVLSKWDKDDIKKYQKAQFFINTKDIIMNYKIPATIMTKTNLLMSSLLSPTLLYK